MAPEDAIIWDRFVTSHPDGTFFHRSGWSKIFRQVFCFDVHYLVAERAGQIVGILPLVLQRSLLFGKALVSSPFCVEGGPLAEDTEVCEVLVTEAIRVQNATAAPYLEFRSRKARQDGWACRKDLYATFARPISLDLQENLQDIPRKQRAVVRKALESRLTSESTSDMTDVHHVYAESVRNLGTPVFARGYFKALVDVFGADCDGVVIREDGEPISAVLNFYHGDTVLPYYGGGTVNARRNGANDLLYWEVMRLAAERGYRRFDFGRSKAGTGAFAFKKNWGFSPEWLEYEYHLRPGASVPDKNPLNPKFSFFIRAWKSLPLPIANLAGPWIVRGLG
jgi:FemAB-related protein (PEP-CTERM system-associated)